MKLVKISIDTNYGEEIESVSLMTNKEIADLYALDGMEIHFYEIMGKHTEFEGTLDASKITVENIGDTAVDVIKTHIGEHISGECVFDYIHRDEIFDNLYKELVQNVDDLIADDNKERLYDYLKDKDNYYKEGKTYSEYAYSDAILELATITEIKELDSRLESEELEREELRAWVNEVIKTL